MSDAESHITAKCTDRARKVLRIAAEAAYQAGHEDIQPDDLKHGLMQAEGIGAAALNEIGWIDPIQTADHGAGNRGLDLLSSQFVQRLLEQAYRETVTLQHNYAGTEHLFLALLEIEPSSVPDPKIARRLVYDILGHDL